MMHAAGRRSSHDSLFSGKWRPWDILVRDHGSQGGRGGRGGGNGMSGGNGGSGGNHNREDNDNSNGEGRGRASGNGNNNGGSGRGGSGNGRGSGSGNSNDDDDDAGGNSNGNGDNNRGDTTTKTQKKTTSARSTTKVPSRTTSTPKAKASPTTTTKEAASPAQTQKAQVVESSTSTPAPSPKTKSPSTEDATAVPATRQPAASNSIASNRDDFTSTSSLNSEATELPVPVTLASSERGGLPSGATQVAGAPGPSTNTASSQSPVPGSGGHRGSSNVGAIAAGVVVGILALLVLIFLGWKFRRSRFLGPITNRFVTNRGGKDRQGINSSPIMGESLLIGAGAMERGRSDGNVSPPAYEDTRSRMEVAAGPLARPSPAMTRSGSHRAHQSTGALHGESSPPRYGDHPRPVPPMAENPTRVPISLIPGPMRVRRATSPTSAAHAAPQQGGMGPPTPNLKRKPVANRTMNNLPVPPPEPYGREPSDVSDRRTTNHSGWSSFLPPNEETTDTDKRHRDSFVSIGGVSIASSGVISPSILNWPMPPSTPPTMSVAGLSEDGRQSAQGRVRPGEQPPTVRQVYRPPTQPIPARANMDTAASAHVNDGAEVLTASRITFQQPSRTVVRVQRRSTQSSAPSSVWSESRQLRER